MPSITGNKTNKNWKTGFAWKSSFLQFLLFILSSCHSTGNQVSFTQTSAARDSVPANPAAASDSSDPAAKNALYEGSPGQKGSREKTILFLGNSITAGYGVRPEQAFPALIQKRIDSFRLAYRVINGGLSGETSAGGKSRIGWVLRQQVSVFVLELGGNDGLRGIPLSATVSNLQCIIDSVKTKYPHAPIILAGMQVPPSMGSQYASGFRELFYRLASKNKIHLIPFILEGVGGNPALNLEDGIHPTPKGHQIVAENVWKILKDLL